MPTLRSGFGVGVVNGKIYAIGGDIGTAVRTVEEYNPTTDVWTINSSIPPAFNNGGFGVGVVNGKIYTIGGFDNNISISTAEFTP